MRLRATPMLQSSVAACKRHALVCDYHYRITPVSPSPPLPGIPARVAYFRGLAVRWRHEERYRLGDRDAGGAGRYAVQCAHAMESLLTGRGVCSSRCAILLQLWPSPISRPFLLPSITSHLLLPSFTPSYTIPSSLHPGDLPSTQSPWTYGYPMHSPLLKPVCTPVDGNDGPVVFDFNLDGSSSKEQESFFTTSVPTTVNATVTNSLSSMLVSLGGGGDGSIQCEQLSVSQWSCAHGLCRRK